MWHKLFIPFIISSITASSGHVIKVTKAGCQFSLNKDVNNYLPLLIDPQGSDDKTFLQPTDNTGLIELEEDQTFELSCPGSYINLSGSSTGESSLLATCSSGTTFLVDRKSVKIENISCQKYPYHTARYSGKACLDQYKEIEIGFDTEENGFITLIKECFDETNQTTLYSVFDLPGSIGGYQSGFPRPNFVQDNFFSLGSSSLESLYKRNKQRTTINSLLGLSSSDNKYIHGTNDYFLSRGHLTAKADFVYGSNQRATFHYVNVVPQWQTFNGKNWNTLEQDVRALASDRRLDLIVYSGSYGITTLPHSSTGKDIPLYLYVSGNKKAIPVPQIMWKIVYEPQTKAAVSFVGINNPYHENIEKERFCKDICDDIDWISWKPSDISSGYGYCCDVNDLRESINTIPKFEGNELLN